MKRFQTFVAAATFAAASTLQAQTQTQPPERVQAQEPAPTASGPSLYGLIDLAAGRFQSAGEPHMWGLQSGQMTTSFIGIKGSDDLGGGLKARFQLESFVRADVGASGRFSNDAFYGRDSFVGLQGDFGSTVLGRNTTPFFLSTVSFNPFGESFGFSPSVRQYYLGSVLGDRSWNNSIAYTNPYDSPVRISLAAGLAEGAPGAGGRNLGGSIYYVAGPFAATLALQRVRNSALGLPAGFVKQDAAQIGATYDFVVLRVFGQYGGVRTSAAVGSRTELVQIGASVPLGRGALLASYGDAATTSAGSDSSRRTFALGYDYSLSKRTDLYAAYLQDRASGVSTGHTLATGMRLRF